MPYCKYYNYFRLKNVVNHIEKKHPGEKVEVKKVMIPNNRVNQKSGADDKDSE